MKLAVLDSGFGGYAALKNIYPQLAIDTYYYYLDNLFAPYGIRNGNFLNNRISYLANKIIYQSDIVALVMLCNTAGVACGKKLADTLSKPIFYVHPNKAILESKAYGGNTLLLATPFSCSNLQTENENIKVVPCENLATDIEKALPSKAKLQFIAEQTSRLIKDCDNVILGCTHYIYLKPYLQKIFPNIRFFDGTATLARELRNAGFCGNTNNDRPKIQLVCSGLDESNRSNEIMDLLFQKK